MVIGDDWILVHHNSLRNYATVNTNKLHEIDAVITRHKMKVHYKSLSVKFVKAYYRCWKPFESDPEILKKSSYLNSMGDHLRSQWLSPENLLSTIVKQFVNLLIDYNFARAVHDLIFFQKIFKNVFIGLCGAILMDCQPEALEPPTKARFADQNRIRSRGRWTPCLLISKILGYLCVCARGIWANSQALENLMNPSVCPKTRINQAWQY